MIFNLLSIQKPSASASSHLDAPVSPLTPHGERARKKFLLSTCLDYRESASEGKSFISRRSLITGWTDGRNLQRLVFEICAELRQAPRRLEGWPGVGVEVSFFVHLMKVKWKDIFWMGFCYFSGGEN
ncbi:hypothetical protein CDAR_236311 [Caerostris darwini]|uniref:Uncharacterized protein n=1 Tax=Caerostris darwini TaxID=1538125 RepID=A0AAV4TA09_9ARAC|nr:hypothetical protein CDAR_236311 [Caerostris darwini]